MSLFSLEDKSNFSMWASEELEKLFPFSDNLILNSELVYNYLDEFEKFKDSKILLVGAGPSTNEVEWQNLDYDYIWSLNHCFLNEKLKQTNIDLICVGGEVDLQSNEFINYVNEYNSLLMFEWHGRWYNERAYFEELYKSYPKLSCFQTRVYGKLGGIPRLLIFALEMKPKEIYFVGMDGCPGVSVETKTLNKNNMKHSFEGGKDSLPHQISETNAYDIYYRQFEELWNYILNDLNYNTKLYNLGENSEYNFSSFWSKKHFPLSGEIKRKINNV